MTHKEDAKDIKYWGKKATKEFAGKTIKEIGYSETEYSYAPVIKFTDETYLVAMSDDEGNDAGALHASTKNNIWGVPTIRKTISR